MESEESMGKGRMRKSQGRYRDPEKDQDIFNLFALPPMMSVEDVYERKIKWA